MFMGIHKKRSDLKKYNYSSFIVSFEVMVVGDGESDRISAKINNCHFFFT